MPRNSILLAVSMLGAAFALQASADDSHTHRTMHAAASSALTDGEVRKVDQAAGKVTIKHGPMPKFDMPAMTMVYRVRDKSVLERLKPGDRIKFDVDGAGSEFTVLRLEQLK